MLKYRTSTLGDVIRDSVIGFCEWASHSGVIVEPEVRGRPMCPMYIDKYSTFSGRHNYSCAASRAAIEKDK